MAQKFIKSFKHQRAISPLMFILFLLTSYNLFPQNPYNLIANYSFENHINCPNLNILNTYPPSPWYEPSNKYLSIYANSCSTEPCSSVPYNCWATYTYQYAHSGDGYVGLFFRNSPNSNGRNYVQTQLLDSLITGKYYYTEFYVSLMNSMNGGCNNISMAISKNAIWVNTANQPDALLPYNAQVFNYGNPIIIDTMNWVKVSSIYKAQGGERFITLGNFKNDSNTLYKYIQTSIHDGAAYYVDDVSVIPLDSMPLQADAGKDTTIHIGDSVFIGSYTNGLDSVKWFNGLMVIDSTRPGFWVKPLVNTCYTLTQTVNNYTSSDTVCINVLPLPVKFVSYSVSIPLQGGVRGGFVENLWRTANEINVSHYNIQRSTNGIGFINIGSVKANNKSSNEYSFTDNGLQSTVDRGLLTLYYRIQSIDNDGKKQYSEVRKVELGIRNLGVSIYPNPAKDVVTIQCKEGIRLVVMLDCLGKEVSHFTGNDNNSPQQTLNFKLLNLKPLPQGLYLLKITTSKNNVYNEKLLVQ